jgi:hypothetical protein
MNGPSFVVAAFGLAGLLMFSAWDAAGQAISPARRSEGRDRARKERDMTKKTGAKGRTEVTVYKPVAYDEPKEGPKLNEVQLTETFMGDVDGEGKARVLQAQWSDGAVRYCTIERVVGALAGRKGTFLLEVQGTVQDKHNKGAWFVIAGSGTGDLRGLRGDGGFEADLGKHGAWTLDYWFE